MRHCILTCKNHPTLRWSTKEIAVSGMGETARYNGSRNIFFTGERTESAIMHSDGSGFRFDHNALECTCPSSDLRLAPEDAIVASRYSSSIQYAEMPVWP